jgi:hypothetical protein
MRVVKIRNFRMEVYIPEVLERRDYQSLASEASPVLTS